MHTLKLTQVGNSVGAIFPKELLARLQLEKGDELYVTESPDGLRITTHNPEFEAQMRVARAICEWKPDVVHAHSPMLVGLPALYAAWYRVKV